jgi:ABC-type uncharacterized transport system permease subunit
MAELLVFPALVAYGEAAVAYARDFRGPGLAGRLATWGVRIGWLLQTALLLAQALTADGFPWGTWAAALNLFVWLVVSVYLVWGCKPRYRMLGAVVMPIVAVLFVLAWAGGGMAAEGRAGRDWTPAAHAALMLAAFAAFTVAAAMAALYLWEEGRLKRRDRAVLRLPPLDALDRLSGRVALAGQALLTAGILIGMTLLDDSRLDASMVVAVGIWSLYALILLLRWEGGLRGRKAAILLLLGSALVAVVLPLTHYAS